MTAIRMRGRLLRWRPGSGSVCVFAPADNPGTFDDGDLPADFAFCDESARNDTVDIDLDGMCRSICWLSFRLHGRVGFHYGLRRFSGCSLDNGEWHLQGRYCDGHYVVHLYPDERKTERMRGSVHIDGQLVECWVLDILVPRVAPSLCASARTVSSYDIRVAQRCASGARQGDAVMFADRLCQQTRLAPHTMAAMADSLHAAVATSLTPGPGLHRAARVVLDALGEAMCERPELYSNRRPGLRLLMEAQNDLLRWLASRGEGAMVSVALALAQLRGDELTALTLGPCRACVIASDGEVKVLDHVMPDAGHIRTDDDDDYGMSYDTTLTSWSARSRLYRLRPLDTVLLLSAGAVNALTGKLVPSAGALAAATRTVLADAQSPRQQSRRLDRALAAGKHEAGASFVLIRYENSPGWGRPL